MGLVEEWFFFGGVVLGGGMYVLVTAYLVIFRFLWVEGG